MLVKFSEEYYVTLKISKTIQNDFRGSIDFKEFADLRYFKGFENFNNVKELINFIYFKYTWDFKYKPVKFSRGTSKYLNTFKQGV